MSATPSRTAVELDAILHPRSIAVVGASTNVDSPGHDYVRSFVEYDFRGPVYPVNPRAQEILGLPAYPTLSAIPGEVDFVVSCIPADGVLALLDECAAKGVKAVELFTGRFSETGRRDAAALERQVLERARAAGIRLIGPNCMGLYDPSYGLSFRPDLPREAGPVAFLSQSGNNAVELVQHGAVRGLRFSKVISYGNGLDLTESDFLEYLAFDDATAVIGAYIEGVRDGPRFLRALRLASSRKPVVVHKGGRTGAGSRSAASHTAALAGQRAVWSAALRQGGAVEASTLEQTLDLLVAFAFLRPGVGRRVGVVGGGGGRAVQSADACEEEGLEVPPLPEDIRAELRAKAPDLWDWVGNPVDQSILAGSGLSGARVLELMVAHPAFDAFIANIGEDWILGRPDAADRLAHVVERFIAIGKACPKPIAFVLGPADSPEEWRWRAVEGARQRLAAERLAVFPTIERAAWALRRFLDDCERRAEP